MTPKTDVVLASPSLVDEFPQVQLGDWVQLKPDEDLVDEIDGEVYEVASAGDLGEVTDKEVGACPTVRWHRTERVFDCHPGAYEVLCPDGFASDEGTTPKKAHVVFLRRGQS